MKIALICDSHFGCRGNNTAFLDKNKLFLDNVFFPYLNEYIISTVVHLGDLVDNRKYININTANRLRQDFLDPLASMGCTAHFITGNHDCFFKNTNEINILQELISDKYPDFYIYDMDACEKIFDNLSILLVPWICQENRERIYQKIKSTVAPIVFGHLELEGFYRHDVGIFSTSGENIDIFKKFDVVCSGHFHHKSSKDNIHYLGAMGEYTWADYNSPRGFHIFDTETRELFFIENPYKMFKKIFYNNGVEETLSDNEYRNLFIKVIIKNKSNVYFFENFINNIEAQSPLNLQIIEDHGIHILDTESVNIDESKSTLDICYSYIDSLEFSNKPKLKETILNLYNEVNLYS
jgi:UDP-2,3-diacylglucosamine pyrophosphatase LpxH